MPTFTAEQHAMEVKNELEESMEKLNKKSKNKILQAIKKMCKNTDSMKPNDNQPQRVGVAPEVTTTTSPTSHENVMMAPRSHQIIT